MVGETPEAYGAGLAAGTLIGNYSEGTLGSLSPDQAYALATEATNDRGSLSLVTGAAPEHVHVLDPDAIRETIMEMYDGQRAVDMIVAAHDTAMRLREETIAKRYDSMYRHAKLTPEQMGRLELDREAGDDTPLNKVREKYFFE